MIDEAVDKEFLNLYEIYRFLVKKYDAPLRCFTEEKFRLMPKISIFYFFFLEKLTENSFELGGKSLNFLFVSLEI